MDDSDTELEAGRTRRELLTGSAGLLATAALAGCTALGATDGRTETDCLTAVSTTIDGEGLEAVRVETDESVTLVVELTDDEATLAEVESLYVGAAGGDTVSYVPYRRLADEGERDPPPTYELPLGPSPVHGEYQVVLDGVGDMRTLAARRVSLSCE